MTDFTELGLDPKVLKAVTDAGYETPTPIQEGAIPAALQGRDVLGIAQTGTGKTAGFVLPMIHMLARGRAKARMPRSLVLAPTRELAAQVAENFDTYARHVKLSKALLIGGTSFKEQDKAIDRGVDVLIATPGRLLDHVERGKLILTDVKVMVVDEADRMLDMGFIPDIERIFQLTPFTRQTLFFSATMPAEIERLTNTFLAAPERIEVARQATASETIEQRVVHLAPGGRRDRAATEKRKLLREVITAEGEACSNAIVFCNRKTEVDTLARSMKKSGLNAAPIHGDLEQAQRTRTLDGFREGTIRFLIASDVAARGLDVPAVSHVFNFDVPFHAEDYVHRIGRTGRAGRDGKAVTLATPADDKALAAIESLLGKPIPVSEAGTAQSAPEPEPAEAAEPPKPKRRRGGGKEAAAPAPAAEASVPAAEAPAPAAAAPVPAAEAPAPEASETRTAEAAPEPAAKDERPAARKANRRGRGNGGKDDTPVGMGDHVPAFLTRSFLPENLES